MAPRRSDSIYNRIRQILESTRASVARSVNTTQVVAYWLIGREIVEETATRAKTSGLRRSSSDRVIVAFTGRLRKGLLSE